MKKQIIFLVAILFGVMAQPTNAQIVKLIPKLDVNLNIKQLEKQKAVVRAREKERLKEEVETINQKLDRGELTKEEAERQKKTAADKHARNIEDQLDIIDANIGLLNRNKQDD